MHLSDLMRGHSLAWYPIAALILFVAVFLAIIVRVMLMPKKKADEIARVPLEDDVVTPRHEGEPKGSKPE